LEVKLKKALLWIVGIALLTGVYVVQDWYRFAKYGEIDPKRGVYGNDHLEVWIDINARMPAPMRKWACKTLLDREAKVIGGVGRAPYGCDPDFDPNATGPALSVALMESLVANATALAGSKLTTEAQKTTLIDCVKAGVAAKVTPEQMAAIDLSPPDSAAMTALTDAGLAATEACMSEQGLN
jgi:hypothetical protein